MCRYLLALLLLTATQPAGAATPAPRDVRIAAPDGALLAATYFAAGTPGPAVLLLHMCNTDRRSWEAVGRQLSAVGIHVLTLDYRGFGERPGERFATAAPQAAQKMVIEQWPGDVDAAFAWLGQQAGVDESRMGAGGGSCGVNQAVQIVAWYVDTLVRAPADPKVPVTPRTTPVLEFWTLLDQPGGVARAVRMFEQARVMRTRFSFPKPS